MTLPADMALVEPRLKADVLLDQVVSERSKHAAEHRRPRSFSAREGLICLEFEALLVMTAAGNLAHGLELTDEDRERLGTAYSRISAIMEEAVG